jgi:hypothetical protein
MTWPAFDSKEELWFSWYIDELIANGYVVRAEYHNPVFDLSERIAVPSLKRRKRIDKEISRFVFYPHTYTPDFTIIWTDIGLKYFCQLDRIFRFNTDGYFEINRHKSYDELVSIVDTKGAFSGPHNNAAVTFPLNQKWVYSKYQNIVQKIVPGTLFDNTFYPERYLMNDEGTGYRKRKIAGKFIELRSLNPKTLNEFICQRKVFMSEFPELMKEPLINS